MICQLMKKFLSVVPILAAMFIPSTAQAIYESSSDTGTGWNVYANGCFINDSD